MSRILSHLLAIALGILLTAAALTPRLHRLRRDRATARCEARTDELTGLANRRGLYEYLDTALTDGRPLGLILFDVDGFKHVNDSRGHEYGDRLLVGIAATLFLLPPTVKVRARLGGDEFVLVTNGDTDRTAAIAHQVKDLIAYLPPTVLGHPVPVGISVGYVISSPEASAAQLVRAADLAMFEAKHSRGVTRWTGNLPDLAVEVRPGQRCRNQRPPYPDPIP